MTGIEVVVLGGLALLSTTFLGVSIKQVVPALFKVSWKAWWKYNRKSIIEKFSKILICYTQAKYPHKELLQETVKRMSALLRKFDVKEIIQLVGFYKELKDIFYNVQFDDAYWLRRQNKLITNPEEMRNYLIKKLYIQRIYDIILIKLYNNPIGEDSKKMLYNDLIEVFLNESISFDSLEKLIKNLEAQLKKQYKSQRQRYNQDFTDEKAFLTQILKDSTRGLDRQTKTALLTAIEIVADCKNVEVSESDNSRSATTERANQAREDSKQAVNSPIFKDPTQRQSQPVSVPNPPPVPEPTPPPTPVSQPVFVPVPEEEDETIEEVTEEDIKETSMAVPSKPALAV